MNKATTFKSSYIYHQGDACKLIDMRTDREFLLGKITDIYIENAFNMLPHSRKTLQFENGYKLIVSHPAPYDEDVTHK